MSNKASKGEEAEREEQRREEKDWDEIERPDKSPHFRSIYSDNDNNVNVNVNQI